MQTHALVIFNTYYFSMATMVIQIHLKVMLYTHRLSCYKKNISTWNLQNTLLHSGYFCLECHSKLIFWHDGLSTTNQTYWNYSFLPSA